MGIGCSLEDIRLHVLLMAGLRCYRRRMEEKAIQSSADGWDKDIRRSLGGRAVKPSMVEIRLLA